MKSIVKSIVKKSICIILVINILLVTGCAGRAAYPVQITQPNDYRISCNQLESEMSRIRHEVQNKTGQKQSGDTKDTVLFVTGLVIFWPALFFMDLKNADKVELRALQSRFNHLSNVYNGKNCR